MAAGRPHQRGLDYFDYKVDNTDNIKMKRLLNKYGFMATALYTEIISAIYKNCFYLELEDGTFYDDIEMKYRCKIDDIKEFIKASVEVGFFHKETFESHNTLTSVQIQEFYFFAAKRREVIKYEIKYWLSPELDFSEAFDFCETQDFLIFTKKKKDNRKPISNEINVNGNAIIADNNQRNNSISVNKNSTNQITELPTEETEKIISVNINSIDADIYSQSKVKESKVNISSSSTAVGGKNFEKEKKSLYAEKHPPVAPPPPQKICMTAAEISEYCQTVGNGVWFQNLAKACGGGEQGKKFVEGFLSDYARANDGNDMDFNDKKHVFNLFRIQCQAEYANTLGKKTTENKVSKVSKDAKTTISIAEQGDIAQKVAEKINQKISNGDFKFETFS